MGTLPSDRARPLTRRRSPAATPPRHRRGSKLSSQRRPALSTPVVHPAASPTRRNRSRPRARRVSVRSSRGSPPSTTPRGPTPGVHIEHVERPVGQCGRAVNAETQSPETIGFGNAFDRSPASFGVELRLKLPANGAVRRIEREQLAVRLQERPRGRVDRLARDDALRVRTCLRELIREGHVSVPDAFPRAIDGVDTIVQRDIRALVVDGDGTVGTNDVAVLGRRRVLPGVGPVRRNGVTVPISLLPSTITSPSWTIGSPSAYFSCSHNTSPDAASSAYSPV